MLIYVSDVVIVSVIGLIGSLGVAFINNAFTKNTKALQALVDRVSAVEKIGLGNRNANKAITRYRLRQEMKQAIGRGWESYEDFEEMLNLYDAYHGVGGNGVIDTMFNEYTKLEKREV